MSLSGNMLPHQMQKRIKREAGFRRLSDLVHLSACYRKERIS